MLSQVLSNALHLKVLSMLTNLPSGLLACIPSLEMVSFVSFYYALFHLFKKSESIINIAVLKDDPHIALFVRQAHCSLSDNHIALFERESQCPF